MAVTTTSTYADLHHVFFYDSSAGTYSANLAGTAAHDYFPDDAAVNDCLYFSASDSIYYFNAKMERIRFNVGTGLVADAITVVWQYLDGSGGWTTLQNVTDGTDAFQNTGTNYLTWSSSIRYNADSAYIGWVYHGVNSINSKWIRCKITAITNISEGGANVTDPIANWEGLATVTSGTEDFAGVYAQLVTDGLGAFCSVDEYAHNYFFRCNIEINSGATLADYSKFVTFGAGFIFNVKTGGTLTLGKVSEGRGYHGCHLIFNSITRGKSLWNGTCNFYGSYVEYLGGRGSTHLNSGVTARDTFFHATEEVYFNGADIYNSKFKVEQGAYSIPFTAGGTVDGFDGFKAASLQFSASTGYTISNVTLAEDSASRVYFYAHGNNPTFILKDSTLRTGTTFYIRGSSGNSATLQLIFSLDLTVVDATGTAIPGATVNISDLNGDAVTGSPFTADANGQISTDLIYQTGPFTKTSSANELVTMDTLTPHTVTITATGYAPRSVKYTMDRQREEIEKLTPDSTNLQDVELYDSTIY